MSQSSQLLIIFVKHPESGKSKTRLAAGIGNDKALEVYRELLRFTCRMSEQIDADKVVWYGNEIPESDLWSEVGYPRLRQGEGSLGDRMEAAFRLGFEQGYHRVVIIGSDCATLTEEIFLKAFASLFHYDIVLGPATDGGYYLLGMNQLFTPVFHGKKWSTESVFADTLADFETANKSCYLLPEHSDIDTMDDLKGTFLEHYLP